MDQILLLGGELEKANEALLRLRRLGRGLDDHKKLKESRVRIWSDSHGRDLNDRLSALLPVETGCYSHVAPGAPLEVVMDSMVSPREIEATAPGDFVVLLGGSNSFSEDCCSQDSIDSFIARLIKKLERLFEIVEDISRSKLILLGGDFNIDVLKSTHKTNKFKDLLASYGLELLFGRKRVFPEKLKFSIIKPIFKKGNRSCPENYRPIALQTIFSKIIERAVFFQINNYFEQNNLLYNRQFGFRKNKSTKQAIFDVVDSTLRALDGSKSIVGIFCDLSKAYDRVNHELLLLKLSYYGFTAEALDFFKSYLTGRRQAVRIIDKKGFSVDSDWLLQPYGIPQGTILGPILFNIYMNDLPNSLDSKVILFADDTTVLVEGSEEDVLLKSQRTISDLDIWLKNNYLQLNSSKTKILKFSASRQSSNGIANNILGNNEANVT
ncbi:hypothetical protein LSTR_LSTR014686, partial [Laodelphax striatellus]